MPENTVEILVKVRDEATRALADVQRQGEQAATGLARANRELGGIVEQSTQQVAGLSKTWREFVGERMGPLMKELGSHGAAMKQIGAEWQAYKGSIEGASGSSLGMARAAGAANEQLALTEGTTRGLTRSFRLATIEIAQSLNPTLGTMVSTMDRAALTAQLTGGRMAGFAGAATVVGAAIAMVIQQIIEWRRRQDELRLSLEGVDLSKTAGKIAEIATEYRKLNELLSKSGIRGDGMDELATAGDESGGGQALRLARAGRLTRELQEQARWQGLISDAARETALRQGADVFTDEDAAKVRKQFLLYAVENVAAQNSIRAAMQQTLQVQAELLRTNPTAGLQEELAAREKVKQILDLQIQSVRALAEAQAKADMYHAPQIRAAAAETVRGLEAQKAGLPEGDRQEWNPITGKWETTSTTASRARLVALGAAMYGQSVGSEEAIAAGQAAGNVVEVTQGLERLRTVLGDITAIRERILAERLEQTSVVETRLFLGSGPEDDAGLAAQRDRDRGLAAQRIALESLTADRVTAVTREQQAVIRLRDTESELSQIRIEASKELQPLEQQRALAYRAANVELERQQVLWSEMVRTDPMVGLRVGLDESIERLTSWGDTARSIVHDTAGAMGRSFESLFTGRINEGLKGLTESIVRTLARIPADLATSAIMQGIRNLLGGGGSSPLGSSPALAAGLASFAPTGSLTSLANVWGATRAWQAASGISQGHWGIAPAEFGAPGMSDYTSVAGGALGTLGRGWNAAAPYLGPGLAAAGGILGLMGSFNMRSPMGVLSGALSGGILGAAITPALGGLIPGLAGVSLGLGVAGGVVLGAAVGILGMLSSSRSSRTPAFSARNQEAAQRIVDMLPELEDQQLAQLLAELETGTLIPDRDLRIRLFNWPPGRWADLRPGGDVDRRIGPGLRQSLIEQVKAEQANRQQLERQTGFLFQEALAPGLTRYEALAGTGSRQRAQAVQAVRRGAFVELVNAAGDAEIEQLITRIRSTAELRAIPILPRRRFVEVLG